MEECAANPAALAAPDMRFHKAIPAAIRRRDAEGAPTDMLALLAESNDERPDSVCRSVPRLMPAIGRKQ
jgi:DNA-binding FadR family transcriptional regulator